jgi:hypothetical protein
MLAAPITAAAHGRQHRSLSVSAVAWQDPTHILAADVLFERVKFCKNIGTCAAPIAETHCSMRTWFCILCPVVTSG